MLEEGQRRVSKADSQENRNTHVVGYNYLLRLASSLVSCVDVQLREDKPVSVSGWHLPLREGDGDRRGESVETYNAVCIDFCIRKRKCTSVSKSFQGVSTQTDLWSLTYRLPSKVTSTEEHGRILPCQLVFHKLYFDASRAARPALFPAGLVPSSAASRKNSSNTHSEELLGEREGYPTTRTWQLDDVDGDEGDAR